MARNCASIDQNGVVVGDGGVIHTQVRSQVDGEGAEGVDAVGWSVVGGWEVD